MNEKIAFIGAGNIASSLIAGLIADGLNGKQIWASDPSADKLNLLAERFFINTTTDNREAANHVDAIVFTVKPDVLPNVSKELSDIIQQRNCLVLSVAAGVRLSDIQRWVGATQAIVRCMPNVAATVGNAATGLFANEHVNEDAKDLAESIMRAVGITVWLEQEEQMDIVTALSGSGPAYFFLIIEALEKAATNQGLPADIAHLLTQQTAMGAIHLSMQTNIDTSSLLASVVSPGGTTAEALKILEKNKVRDIFAEALQAAQRRAAELADQYQTI